MSPDDHRIRNTLRIEIGTRALIRSMFRPGALPLSARLNVFMSQWAGLR